MRGEVEARCADDAQARLAYASELELGLSNGMTTLQGLVEQHLESVQAGAGGVEEERLLVLMDGQNELLLSVVVEFRDVRGADVLHDEVCGVAVVLQQAEIHEHLLESLHIGYV